MKYQVAQLELQKILRTQKVVSIKKLNRIIESMNISLYGKPFDAKEVEYLKNEIKKRDKVIGRLKNARDQV